MALRIDVWLSVARSAGRSRPRQDRRARARRGGAAAVAVAFALAGCGLTGESNTSFLVDPSRYDGYRCNDLAAQWKALAVRQQELQNLMDKAGDGGGAVIGAITYRADYATVLDEEKLLRHTAAEKNCALTPTYQSDQTIR